MSDIVLVSKNDAEFTISLEAASISPVLKNMLSSAFMEGHQRRVELKEIDPHVLEKVADYLEYRYKYIDATEDEDLPEFEVPTEMSLELLLVADYLNI
ncbi:LADA_0D05732g1_1 [Lachancea dasiensis]|uniref:Elongin-C n=1 Tax=Lachancea dasiensis TaxID=1072105 RepID=A0A1G4J5U3_9SACH|nr:LADA_0D05732g1_1 [Lachancea dasiensis]